MKYIITILITSLFVKDKLPKVFNLNMGTQIYNKGQLYMARYNTIDSIMYDSLTPSGLTEGCLACSSMGVIIQVCLFKATVAGKKDKKQLPGLLLLLLAHDCSCIQILRTQQPCNKLSENYVSLKPLRVWCEIKCPTLDERLFRNIRNDIAATKG